MLFLLTTGMAAMLELASGSWLVISDDVMGGKSQGQTISTPKGIRFEGELSLENNGGFSSTRRTVPTAPVGAQGVRMEVRGDGRFYEASLRHSHQLDGISWRAEFKSSRDWEVIEIPFASFEAVFRGRPVDRAGPVDPSKLRQVGFLLADKREGPFHLEIQNMEFYR